MTPIRNRVYCKFKVWTQIGATVLIYLVYMVLVNLVNNLNGTIKILLTASVIDFIGYSFVVFISIFILNLKDKIKIGWLFGLLFLLLAIKKFLHQLKRLNIQFNYIIYHMHYLLVYSCI